LRKHRFLESHAEKRYLTSKKLEKTDEIGCFILYFHVSMNIAVTMSKLPKLFSRFGTLLRNIFDFILDDEKIFWDFFVFNL